MISADGQGLDRCTWSRSGQVEVERVKPPHQAWTRQGWGIYACHVTCRRVVPASRSSIRRRESWPPKMQGVSRAACMHGSLNGRASCLSMPRFDSRWVDWLIGTTCMLAPSLRGWVHVCLEPTEAMERETTPPSACNLLSKLDQTDASFNRICSLNWMKCMACCRRPDVII